MPVATGRPSVNQPEIDGVVARRMSIGAWDRPVALHACAIVTGFALGLMLASASADPPAEPSTVALTTGPVRVSDIANPTSQ
jgi:hypothetical protein